MPKVDVTAVPARTGAGYPNPFGDACARPHPAACAGRLDSSGCPQVQRLILLLLLLPAVCHALGAEDTEFYARTRAGQVLRLKFVEDPQPWSGQNFIYGAAGTRSLSLCWSEKLNEVRKSFVCTTARGAAPALIYELLGTPDKAPTYNDQSPQAAEYRAIAGKARLGKGTERGDRVLEAIFVCKQGCSPEVPRYIYEVSTYD